jgi:glycosyltransferase involved in cell wall biosynthesis
MEGSRAPARQTATGTNRRILVLAYFFPPLGGAGVQRTLKFTRYLPECGWDPTVVTTRSTAYPVSDGSLIDEVPPGVRIVRAAEPGAWRWLIRGVTLACAVLRRRLPVPWPDEMLGWAPSALWHVLREIRRSRPDVLYSTSAPYTAHLVALAAHRLTGIPWVADFRDEWATNPHTSDHPPLVTRLSVRAERAVARAAARRVVVAAYFELAGDGPEPVEITNGVDEADLAGLPAATPAITQRLRLTYVGTLYGIQDCEPVFAALRRLVADGRLDPARLELRVIGNDWLENLEARVPIAVSKSGYLDHRAAVAEMRTATALLFYRDPASPAPSGKLYEYLVAERPILCVARPDNLAYRLVEEWDAGICASAADPAAIEAAILELVRRWEAGELRGSATARERTLERYSRRALTAQLAGVLSEACAQSPADASAATGSRRRPGRSLGRAWRARRGRSSA